MYIFRPYSRPNLFRGLLICPYLNLNIKHPIPYLYPDTQIAYLWCRYPIVSYLAWLTLSVSESEYGQKYENKYNISDIRPYPIRFHPYDSVRIIPCELECFVVQPNKSKRVYSKMPHPGLADTQEVESTYVRCILGLCHNVVLTFWMVELGLCVLGTRYSLMHGLE
jgi:hypothetical protein